MEFRLTIHSEMHCRFDKSPFLKGFNIENTTSLKKPMY